MLFLSQVESEASCLLDSSFRGCRHWTSTLGHRRLLLADLITLCYFLFVPCHSISDRLGLLAFFLESFQSWTESQMLFWNWWSWLESSTVSVFAWSRKRALCYQKNHQPCGHSHGIKAHQSLCKFVGYQQLLQYNFDCVSHLFRDWTCRRCWVHAAFADHCRHSWHCLISSWSFITPSSLSKELAKFLWSSWRHLWNAEAWDVTKFYDLRQEQLRLLE